MSSTPGSRNLPSSPSFRSGKIHDIYWESLQSFPDPRGYLCELFRQDELPAEFQPVMAYVSASNPGIVRGPHEHTQQADLFCFLGPFQIDLWDNRPSSPSYLVHERAVLETGSWTRLIVPPGIVHAYKNLGLAPALVINCPNRLYKGPRRLEPVDEIRHEDDPESPFRVEIDN